MRPIGLTLAVLFCATSLFGQLRPNPGRAAMIQGEILLPNGNPAPFVYLTLEPENGGGLIQSASTDSAGFYAIAGVAVGANYSMVIQVQGFQPINRLVMVTSYMTVEDFTLEPLPAGAEPHKGAVVSIQHLQIPSKALAQYVEGVREMDAGNNQAAEASFREAIRIYPQFAACFRHLGAVDANLGRFPEAHRNIDRAVKLDKANSENYAYLGYVYMQQKQLDQAEQAFRKSIQISKSDWLAQLELVRIEYDRKDYQGAYPAPGSRQQALQDRQYESGGLTGPGLGEADYVAALHDWWNGLKLDWGRGGVPHRPYTGNDVRAKTEAVETH